MYWNGRRVTCPYRVLALARRAAHGGCRDVAFGRDVALQRLYDGTMDDDNNNGEHDNRKITEIS